MVVKADGSFHGNYFKCKAIKTKALNFNAALSMTVLCEEAGEEVTRWKEFITIDSDGFIMKRFSM